MKPRNSCVSKTPKLPNLFLVVLEEHPPRFTQVVWNYQIPFGFSNGEIFQLKSGFLHYFWQFHMDFFQSTKILANFSHGLYNHLDFLQMISLPSLETNPQFWIMCPWNSRICPRLLDTSRPALRRSSSLHQEKVIWRPWFLKDCISDFWSFVWGKNDEVLSFVVSTWGNASTKSADDSTWSFGGWKIWKLMLLEDCGFWDFYSIWTPLRFAVWTTPSTTRPTTMWCPTPLAPPTAWLLSSMSCWRRMCEYQAVKRM